VTANYHRHSFSAAVNSAEVRGGVRPLMSSTR
jgi:hypothetical protein